MASVSVVLITLNAERLMDRCLESVAWADEIIVVDSFSTDGTLERARRFTDRIYQHEFPGSSRQTERAIGYATGDWIFMIDADEVCTPELAREIQDIVGAAPDPDAPRGYEVLRRVSAFGKWIDHGGWYPDYAFRLVRRDSVVAMHQEVHGAFTTDGPVGRLQGLMLHYTYDTIFSYLQRLNTYSSLQVGNKIASRPDIRSHWTKIVFSPLSHFWRMFVVKQGWRDGYHGLALAALDAMVAQALYLKLWEYRMREDAGADELPPIRNEDVNRAMRNL